MSFLILENVRSGVNEFLDGREMMLYFNQGISCRQWEGPEEDGSVPFFNADMLPDGLAELYMRCYKEAFRGAGTTV